MGCSGSFNLHRKSGQNLWLCMEEKRKNSSSSSYTHRVHKGNKLLAPHLTKKESFWCNWRRRWLGLEAIWGIYWAERKQSGNFKMVLFGLVWIRISVCTIYIPVPLNPIVFFLSSRLLTIQNWSLMMMKLLRVRLKQIRWRLCHSLTFPMAYPSPPLSSAASLASSPRDHPDHATQKPDAAALPDRPTIYTKKSGHHNVHHEAWLVFLMPWIVRDFN